MVQMQENEEQAQAKLLIQRKENRRFIQSKDIHRYSTDSDFENNLNRSKGSGAALPEKIKAEMEKGFGHDFSNIKIHTDSNAVQMSHALIAQAFTKGKDIYFNSGKYDPGSSQGKNLIAHELTHTIQQGKSPSLKRKNIHKADSLSSNTSGLDKISIKEKTEFKRILKDSYIQTKTAMNSYFVNRVGKKAGKENPELDEELKEEFLEVAIENKNQKK